MNFYLIMVLPKWLYYGDPHYSCLVIFLLRWPSGLAFANGKRLHERVIYIDLLCKGSTAQVKPINLKLYYILNIIKWFIRIRTLWINQGNFDFSMLLLQRQRLQYVCIFSSTKWRQIKYIKWIIVGLLLLCVLRRIRKTKKA